MATASASRFFANVGPFDRLLRVVLGLVILLAGLRYENWWGLVGLVPLVTGLVGFCPLYRLFGLSTRPSR